MWMCEYVDHKLFMGFPIHYAIGVNFQPSCVSLNINIIQVLLAFLSLYFYLFGYFFVM